MIWRIKNRIREYELRHLHIGRVKQMSKKGYTDFCIEKISWDVHWQTNLYLAVIIRDYLRFFIKNTLAIGNCVIDDKAFFYKPDSDGAKTDYYAKKWEELVNSVADEFDDWIKMYNYIDSYEGDDLSYMEELKDLQRKAFGDLAEIYDELFW